MKLKRKNFRVGDNTYFHHRHGTFVRGNLRRSLAIGASSIVVLFGGFFVGKTYAWPLLKGTSGVQRVQQIAGDKLVSAEEDPGNKSAEPIRSEDELLKSVIEDKLKTFPTDQKWSVFVYDLDTERTATVNIDETHDSASLYKLYLLEALEAKLPFDQWQWTWVGNSSVKDCVDKMLKTSDDPCAQELGDFVDWNEIQKSAKENGFNNTRLTANDGRETTASDTGELLAKLKKGQMLSDNARRFVFDSLYQQTIKQGIQKGCKNCRAANKIGELSNIAHDAGVVTHGTHDYVLVIMSEGGDFKQVEEITKLVELEFAPASRMSLNP